MAYRYYYEIVVEHRGLHKHRVIRGPSRDIVEAKAYAQRRTWNEQYAKKCAVEQREAARERKRQELEESLLEAEQRTQEAQQQLASLRGILAFTLRVDDRVDWERLKNRTPFAKPQPVPKPYLSPPTEPQSSDASYQPTLNLLDKVIPALRRKKEAAAEAQFQADHAAWRQKASEVGQTNQRIYNRSLQAAAEWTEEARAYEAARRETNEAIERRQQSYTSLVPEAITDYCDLVLSQSRYPDCLSPEFQLDYRPQTKTCFVEYRLPASDVLPRLTDVRFVRSRGEFNESFLSDREFDQFYEDVLCQIALRTIHELFEADVVRALDAMVFNGTVTALDKSSGNVATTCVMSVRAPREEFLRINLRNVEARRCFKALGGVTGGKLIELPAVVPVGTSEDEESHGAAAGAPPTRSDEWNRLVAQLPSPNDAVVMPMADLAACFGFVGREKLTMGESRELVEAIALRGYCIEPDVCFGAPAYRCEHSVVLFKPHGNQVRESVYTGAAALLQLCVLIAAADEQVHEQELDVFREFIEKNVALSRDEHHRLRMLERFLVNSPAFAKAALTRIARRVPAGKRELVADVLVYVAAADGKITSREWTALERAFSALELPPDTLDKLVKRLSLGFQEATIQEAGAALAGEPIPPTPQGAVVTTAQPETFTLDMSRVRQIVAETSEVVSILGKVMTDDLATVAVPPAAPSPQSVAVTSVPDWTAGLDAKYQPVIIRLVEKPSWLRKEFDQLAAACKLMPLGVFDAINEWAETRFGDFLLEGEETIVVQTHLIQKGN